MSNVGRTSELARKGGRNPISERERKVLDIIETVRSKRPKFKDAAITMAHGAGGKATQTLIEGLFVPAFGSEAGAVMGDAGAVGESRRCASPVARSATSRSTAPSTTSRSRVLARSPSASR